MSIKKKNSKKKSHNIFKKISFLLVLGICLATITLVYALKIEPNWVQIINVNLKLTGLAEEFDDFKIVQISDIHIDESMTQKRFERFIELVNLQKPDVVAITGDFVTENPLDYAPILRDGLQQLNPKIKTFAVLGNHDYWSNPTVVSQVLLDSNILELNNQVYTLKKQAQLNFAGIDDVWAGKPDLDLVLKELPQEGPTVLLVHEPDFADTIANLDRFDLQLSGHSHGGQVRLPFFGAPILPYLGKKYSLGRYQVENTIVYTNRGLGTVILPLRFNCRPEITVFHLHQNK